MNLQLVLAKNTFPRDHLRSVRDFVIAGKSATSAQVFPLFCRPIGKVGQFLQKGPLHIDGKEKECQFWEKCKTNGQVFLLFPPQLTNGKTRAHELTEGLLSVEKEFWEKWN